MRPSHVLETSEREKTPQLQADAAQTNKYDLAADGGREQDKAEG